MADINLSNLILNNGEAVFHGKRKPPWLRARLPGGQGYHKLRQIVEQHGLHTVCRSAKCPNMGECWSKGTATIMILGNVCTRSCGFCHIQTGRPPLLDVEEPDRVAEAVALMNLNHVVITSVNRDELPDGGASIWAETISSIRSRCPQVSIEVLIPDFCGNWESLQQVMDQRPAILNHNLETVSRLYSVVRPQAKYRRSIELLKRAKQDGLMTKTGLMVGIGETDEEVIELMAEVRQESGCDMLTIGQYLQPTAEHLPVTRWVSPDTFDRYREIGMTMGWHHIESGPLVRSSYHAENQYHHL